MNKTIKSGMLQTLAAMMIGAKYITDRLHYHRKSIGKRSLQKKKAKRRTEKNHVANINCTVKY